MTAMPSGSIRPDDSLMCSIAVTGTGFAAGVGMEEGADVEWQVPEETAVAFEYNGRSHAVMMATPADLENFALGFSLAEEIVGTAADIEKIAVRETPLGFVLNLTVDPLRLLRGSLRSRSMEGRSGCGLCGVDSLVHAVREPRKIETSLEVEPAAVAAAFRALPDHQPMNRANRSVHAAAWCAPDGSIRLAREDVGRHNALDKLIGAIAASGADPAGGFVVMTSRCSFELVQKTAAVGIPLLATISAPTALALELARNANLTLGALSRRDTVILFR
ncbi:formate dehydrogenase accessory sulfurtransferase FdhD (plasmid) [Azospirillum oryzae]|uniref:Sulfur carrier protein FdhD n=1 Tax=Azospirillum oryzae TaxID=286727 RepID=A0A6N1B3N8_9PROT|nr:formate dehydrogenase accessory sulfurtransferase FdhD [Azospirillum oryzae]KAA0587065.1 formate dehydrogenase accessory sulfurtransferase FdhD [Azospirillum oryzae]QKS54072.1 formate dehydrogenase accessory sulfurtransferase FdhD [Azospirillum oryzae]GLR82255.1 sulfurtransferase FdhD [Azospirillum oryzae]